MRLTSWGKYPWVDTTLESPRTETAAIGLLDGASSLIGRGLGRSYGDSALNRSVVVSCLTLDPMESFD